MIFWKITKCGNLGPTWTGSRLAAFSLFYNQTTWPIGSAYSASVGIWDFSVSTRPTWAQIPLSPLTNCIAFCSCLAVTCPLNGTHTATFSSYGKWILDKHGFEQRFSKCGQQTLFVSITNNSASKNVPAVSHRGFCRPCSFKVLELCRLAQSNTVVTNYVRLEI